MAADNKCMFHLATRNVHKDFVFCMFNYLRLFCLSKWQKQKTILRRLTEKKLEKFIINHISRQAL